MKQNYILTEGNAERAYGQVLSIENDIRERVVLALYKTLRGAYGLRVSVYGSKEAISKDFLFTHYTEQEQEDMIEVLTVVLKYWTIEEAPFRWALESLKDRLTLIKDCYADDMAFIVKKINTKTQALYKAIAILGWRKRDREKGIQIQ